MAHCTDAAGMSTQAVDVSETYSIHSRKNKIGRILWGLVYLLLFRPSPKPLHAWRRFLLRLFGAKMAPHTYVYSSCKIWAPWNLEMREYACISHYVDCYCVSRITIGAHATVSQYSFLCGATHDAFDPQMRLIAAPITIEDKAWICADVFVGPGVTIGEGTVVGARASVFKDLPAWKICVGSPAVPVKDRKIREVDSEE